MRKNYIIGMFGMVGVALVAIAATVWPFIINNYYPGLTYAADMANEFAGAANVPRKVMNYQVASIKKGDIVRVIYADGQIYDFETTAACSPTASFSCPFLGNGTRRASINEPATSSVVLSEAKVANDNLKCSGGGVGGSGSSTVPVQTGFWGTTAWLDSANNWNIVGGWFSTGIVYIQYLWRSPFPKMCP